MVTCNNCGKTFKTEKDLGVHIRFSKAKEYLPKPKQGDNMLELFIGAVEGLMQQKHKHLEAIEQINRDLQRLQEVASKLAGESI